MKKVDICSEKSFEKVDHISKKSFEKVFAFAYIISGARRRKRYAEKKNGTEINGLEKFRKS